MWIHLEKLQSEISKRYKHLLRRNRPQQGVVVTKPGERWRPRCGNVGGFIRTGLGFLVKRKKKGRHRGLTLSSTGLGKSLVKPPRPIVALHRTVTHIQCWPSHLMGRLGMLPTCSAGSKNSDWPVLNVTDKKFDQSDFAAGGSVELHCT